MTGHRGCSHGEAREVDLQTYIPFLAAIAAVAGQHTLAAAQGVEELVPCSIVSFCVIPDAHTRTGTLRYLPSIIQRINALPIQPDFVMALGDNVSGGKDDQVLADAVKFEECYSGLRAPHYYVIGNHECIPVEVYNLLTWDQLLAAWHMKSRWYSFDVGRFHVCVLDGWVGMRSGRFKDVFRAQQDWFIRDLAGTGKKTIVFVHQAIGFQQPDLQHWIDTDNRKFWPPGNFFEKTIEANRDKIVGVFEGHKHKAFWKRQNGIAYHQMGASHMENGQFAQVFIDADSGGFHVLAHPDLGKQNAAASIQQTYGDPKVMARRTRWQQR